MSQSPLFRPALAAVAITARYEFPDGWKVSVGTLREGETWGDVARSTYDHLTTAEALDVLEAEVGTLQASA